MSNKTIRLVLDGDSAKELLATRPGEGDTLALLSVEIFSPDEETELFSDADFAVVGSIFDHRLVIFCMGTLEGPAIIGVARTSDRYRSLVDGSRFAIRDPTRFPVPHALAADVPDKVVDRALAAFRDDLNPRLEDPYFLDLMSTRLVQTCRRGSFEDLHRLLEAIAIAHSNATAVAITVKPGLYPRGKAFVALTDGLDTEATALLHEVIDFFCPLELRYTTQVVHASRMSHYRAYTEPVFLYFDEPVSALERAAAAVVVQDMLMRLRVEGPKASAGAD